MHQKTNAAARTVAMLLSLTTLLWSCGDARIYDSTNVGDAEDAGAKPSSEDSGSTDGGADSGLDADALAGPSCSPILEEDPGTNIAHMGLAWMTEAADGSMERFPPDDLDTDCSQHTQAGPTQPSVGEPVYVRGVELVDEFGPAAKWTDYYVLVPYDDPDCRLPCGETSMLLEPPSDADSTSWVEIPEAQMPANVPCGDDGKHYFGAVVTLNFPAPGAYRLDMLLADSHDVTVLDQRMSFCMDEPE